MSDRVVKYVKIAASIVIGLSGLIYALDNIAESFGLKDSQCEIQRKIFDKSIIDFEKIQKEVVYPNFDIEILEEDKYFADSLVITFEKAAKCRDSVEVRSIINQKMDLARSNLEVFIREWALDQNTRDSDTDKIDFEARSFVYMLTAWYDNICSNDLKNCDLQVKKSFQKTLKTISNDSK